jgi:hypothetical protein
MGFNPDNYEPVADRLARAHADHPELRVITDLVAVERDENKRPLQYIVRAQIYIGDVLKAQDYAEEMVGSSPVNRTSALENCTTSAIGRALADMGYQGSINGKNSRPSREEMEKVQRAETSVEPISAEKIKDAHLALEQAQEAKSLPELTLVYNGASLANLLNIEVQGLTLNNHLRSLKKDLETGKGKK